MPAASRRIAIALVGSALLAGMIPAGVATDTTLSVTNVAPVVGTVTLPGSSINPTSGTTTSVSVTIAVTDANGYNDISSVTVEVLKPDGSTTHVASAAATFSSGTGTSATYTKSFNMNFHDDPALSTSTYKVKVTATDSQGATGTNLASLAVFNYAQLAALNLNVSSLNLGSSLSPGATTSVVAMGVQNYGNVQIDVQLSGTALSHASANATIPVGSLKHSTASNMASSSSLGTSASALGSFNLAKGSSSSSSLYWQLTVPSGSDQWVPSGTYTGAVTVAAVSG